MKLFRRISANHPSDAGIDAGKLTPDGKNAEEMKKNLFDEDT